MGKNEMTVTILDDGRVKVETSQFVGAVHTTAEKFLVELQKQLGGEATRTKVGHGHNHVHSDGTVHSHE
jgi:hypothetical protein